MSDQENSDVKVMLDITVLEQAGNLEEMELSTWDLQRAFKLISVLTANGWTIKLNQPTNEGRPVEYLDWTATKNFASKAMADAQLKTIPGLRKIRNGIGGEICAYSDEPNSTALMYEFDEWELDVAVASLKTDGTEGVNVAAICINLEHSGTYKAVLTRIPDTRQIIISSTAPADLGGKIIDRCHALADTLGVYPIDICDGVAAWRHGKSDQELAETRAKHAQQQLARHGYPT